MLFVQNWQFLDVPVNATLDGHSGRIMATRAEGTRVLFQPNGDDPDFRQNLDVLRERVETD